MKPLKLLILIIGIVLITSFSSLATPTLAGDYGFDNPTLPTLQPDEVTGTNIITGANYSINVNRTEYWDDLDTPADIDWLTYVIQFFDQWLNTTSDVSFNSVNATFSGDGSGIDLNAFNGTWQDNINDSVDSSELDNICGVDGQIVLRTGGTWDCTPLPETYSATNHLNYTKVISDNVIELKFVI